MCMERIVRNTDGEFAGLVIIKVKSNMTLLVANVFERGVSCILFIANPSLVSFQVVQ